MEAYKKLEKQNEEIQVSIKSCHYCRDWIFPLPQSTIASTEKKAQRRIAELNEVGCHYLLHKLSLSTPPQVQELEKQAKAHLEEVFRQSLEEKDEKINVLQTQVSVDDISLQLVKNNESFTNLMMPPKRKAHQTNDKDL